MYLKKNHKHASQADRSHADVSEIVLKHKHAELSEKQLRMTYIDETAYWETKKIGRIDCSEMELYVFTSRVTRQF